MKRILILLCIVLLITLCLYNLGKSIFVNTDLTDFIKEPKENTPEQLYHDIALTLLAPHIDIALNNYYGEPTQYGLYDTNILDINRPNGLYKFDVRLKVTPFVGAHNTIGEDVITFRISSGEVIFLDFVHLKDYPRLQN